MIVQGSEEWHALRLGKATASRIADIMRTTKTGVSASRERYLGELVAERLTGCRADGFKSADMEWGNETEAQARGAYAIYSGGTLTPVPFVDHPFIPMAGASPDHLVNDDGLVEIKCPATHTHIATLLGGKINPDYLTQMQWQMACTNRLWCDFVSFDPRMPEDMRLFVQRVERDDKRIAELEAAVDAFLGEVAATINLLQINYRQAA